jgi:putative spermidine/putrescine transport system permease protein
VKAESRARTFRDSLYHGLRFSVTLAVALYLIVPVFFSALAGVSRNVMTGVSGGLTTRWLVQVFELYHETLLRSMGIALACVAACLGLGVPMAYALTRQRRAIARLIEELLMLPVAVPGLATGLALILAYGNARDFRASSLFILTGHVLFTLPFMMRSVLAVMHAADLPVLEEAAASLGASFWQRFRTVVLPNARSGMMAGSLMVFSLSIGEFNITWMLHTPLTQTLPVGLADAYSSLRLEVGSAYTIVFLAMVVPVLWAMQLVGAPLDRLGKK